MFEVGKKYKFNSVPTLYTCLWTNGEDVLFDDPNGLPFVEHSHSYLDQYREYVEPKVGRVTRHIRRSEYSEDGFTACMRENSNQYDWCGSIELTFTDGKLTNVEIVE